MHRQRPQRHKCACAIQFHVARIRNGVQFEIKSLQSFRLSFFIVPADIISVLVDKTFTMNVTGMVLESL